MEDKKFHDEFIANPTLGKIGSDLFPSLEDRELAGLARWCIVKEDQDRYPILRTWLAGCIETEVLRRQSGGQIEKAMIELPVWNGWEVADALLGCYSLFCIGLTTAQKRVVHEIFTVIVVDAHLEIIRLSGIANAKTQNT